MENISKQLLVSFFIVIAIIAVGSYMFINREKTPDPKNSFPIPIPTLNKQVINTVPSVTTTSKTVPVTVPAATLPAATLPVTVPAATIPVVTVPVDINNTPIPVVTNASYPENIEIDYNYQTEQAESVVFDEMTVTEIQRLTNDVLFQRYAMIAIFVAASYQAKAKEGWTNIEVVNEEYLKIAIKNMVLLINELRVRSFLSEKDFYKVMAYSEIYYRCSQNPNSIQCKENYTLDGELPLLFNPTYSDLNYTFERYESEIVIPEINRLRRENRRYDIKYLELRTYEEKNAYLNSQPNPVPTTQAPMVPTTQPPMVPTTQAPMVPTTQAPMVQTQPPMVPTQAPMVPTTQAPMVPENCECLTPDIMYSNGVLLPDDKCGCHADYQRGFICYTQGRCSNALGDPVYNGASYRSCVPELESQACYRRNRATQPSVNNQAQQQNTAPPPAAPPAAPPATNNQFQQQNTAPPVTNNQFQQQNTAPPVAPPPAPAPAATTTALVPNSF